MHASRMPPGGYVRAGSVTLEGNRRLLLWLNLASLPALAIAGYGFAGLASLVRPGLSDGLEFSLSSSSPAPLPFVLALFGLRVGPRQAVETTWGLHAGIAVTALLGVTVAVLAWAPYGRFLSGARE